MQKCVLKFLFIFFVIAHIANCQKWNNGRSNVVKKNWRAGGYSDEGNGRPPPSLQPSETSAPSKSQAVGRGGIGAWGYIAIVLFLIISSLGIYYTIIFYPIVCKKQRMYHVMGSTTV